MAEKIIFVQTKFMSQEKETTRLEAFSDGVFAIAATLLILEVKVPRIWEDATAADLWKELGRLWPSYFAFTITFFAILISWINHHDTFKMLNKTSRPFIYANGLLLMLMTFFPFPTALLAEYITTKSNSAAAVFYCGYHLLVSIAYNILSYTVRKPVYLLKPEVSKKFIARLVLNTRIGLFVYMFTTLLCIWFPMTGIIINSSLWILWATMSYTEKQKA
jgi:uncharacterized membrane protein